jgi:hypothetical protein
VEDAPVVPEMGTIEAQAFRARYLRTVQGPPRANHRLHAGRVSERSKKAGWHHVRYSVPRANRPMLIPFTLITPSAPQMRGYPSTGSLP